MIIPFFIPHYGCPHQCVFCNQKTITGSRKPINPEHIPIVIESYLRSSCSQQPAEAAFYGGSFTALPIENQKSFLEAVQPAVRSGKISRIRVSTRPDCITPDILMLLRGYGVKIVELGVQSMDDAVLTLSGRGHTALDSVNAVSLLKDYGFSIGIQIMTGLPGDSGREFNETIEKIIRLSPNFVRIYPVVVIRNTPLAELFLSGRYAPLPLNLAVTLCANALDRFRSAGIPVIRIGLQPTEELMKQGAVLGGPYHPAFCQLVESLLFLRKMRELAAKEKNITFLVNPVELSSAIGQKRENILSLKKEGIAVSIRTDPSVSRGDIRVKSR